VNIPATLDKCRAELKRQQEMEDADKSRRPWKYSEWRSKGQKYGRWGIGNEDGSGQILSGFVRYWHHPEPFKLIVLSRNLNPARLKVAGLLIESGPDEDLAVAAALLGVEVRL